MLPVVPDPPSPSSRPTAVLRRRSLISQHPQPADAKTECRERIRLIVYKLLDFTQLAVISGQRLGDSDMVALRNGSHIHTHLSAKCMACIEEVKLICLMGNPGIRGGFTMQNPVFITWLHLSMLIDIHTPLVIPN
jgi:hypothetical protein